MKHPEDENIRAAYEVADESGKKMLCALYPDVFKRREETDNRLVTERIKTFEDACNALGDDHLYVQMFRDIYDKSEKAGANENRDVVAYLKLRIVTAALNEGWTPDYNDKQQRKWYPWFYIYSEDEYNELSEDDKCRVVGRAYHSAVAYGGLVYAHADNVSTYSFAVYGSRLAFKSEGLAKYCGKQFGELWAAFLVG